MSLFNEVTCWTSTQMLSVIYRLLVVGKKLSFKVSSIILPPEHTVLLTLLLHPMLSSIYFYPHISQAENLIFGELYCHLLIEESKEYYFVMPAGSSIKE